MSAWPWLPPCHRRSAPESRGGRAPKTSVGKRDGASTLRTLESRSSVAMRQTSSYLVASQARVPSNSLTLDMGSVARRRAYSAGGSRPEARRKGKLGAVTTILAAESEKYLLDGRWSRLDVIKALDPLLQSGMVGRRFLLHGAAPPQAVLYRSGGALLCHAGFVTSSRRVPRALPSGLNPVCPFGVCLGARGVARPRPRRANRHHVRGADASYERK